MACCLVIAIPVARRERTLLPLLAPVLAPLGTLVYFTYLRLHVGSFTAWFIVEHRDFHASSDPVTDLVQRFAHYIRTAQVNPLLVGCYLLASVVLFALLIWDRNPPVLIVYAAGMVLFALANPEYPSSIPRLLLPAFPLLLPIIVRVERVPRRYLSVAALVSAGIMGLVCVYMTAYSNVSI